MVRWKRQVHERVEHLLYCRRNYSYKAEKYLRKGREFYGSVFVVLFCLVELLYSYNLFSVYKTLHAK